MHVHADPSTAEPETTVLSVSDHRQNPFRALEMSPHLETFAVKFTVGL